jgi:alpha-1,2-mannosyltransferase
VPGHAVSRSAQLRVVLIALFAASLFVHGRDLWTSGLIDGSGRIKGSDFIRLYTTGGIAAEGRWSDLFIADAHLDHARAKIDPRLEMQGLHPNYGPTAALFLSPFSRFSFVTAWALFSVLTTSVLLFGMWLLARESGIGPNRDLVLLAAIASPAWFITMRYGQLSALSTGLLALAGALDLRGRPFAGGVVLGLLAYKPYLILPALLIWFVAGHHRAMLGGIVGAAIHILTGVLAAGWQVTLRWFEVLGSLGQNPELVQGFPNEVHSLVGFTRLLGFPPPLPMTVAIAGSLAALVITTLVWRRKTSLARRWGVLVLATLLAAPHLLTYDLMLLTPALLLAVQNPVNHERLLALVVIGLYLSPIFSPPLAAITGVQISALLMAVLLTLQAFDGVEPQMPMPRHGR